MKIRVVSLMYGSAWDRYGRYFAESFTKFWPESIELVVVTDRALPISRPNTRQVDLNAIPGVTDFRRRHKDNPKANGLGAPAGMKRDEKDYAWRLDAMKWMPQAMAPLPALEGMYDGDILVWFDADVETTSTVPFGWVAELLGDGDVACLRRGKVHSEIGCYIVRIGKATRAFLKNFAALYADDLVFKLRETHSAFIFDRSLECFSEIRVTNLNPDGGKGHVWPRSPLAEHTVHRKGERKDKR